MKKFVIIIVIKLTFKIIWLFSAEKATFEVKTFSENTSSM